MNHENFFQHYFNFIDLEHQEAPANCHRWSAISIVAALLGRQVYLPFGHSYLIPNHYIQIIGLPASRKSTAIKIAKKVLEGTGYTNFAAEKTSLEKFLIDLHELTWGEEGAEQKETTDLEEQLFGTVSKKQRASEMPIAEMYIASDEFVDFIGRNNVDFISQLGSFWDYRGVFDRKLKHSTAVYINEPTINIIAGNTPVMFNQAFPPDIQGQGFFSRLLLIHAEATGRQIAWPAPPDAITTKTVLDYLAEIKKCCMGEMIIGSSTRDLVATIYSSWQPIDDHRFEHYSGRRQSHLLKLSMVCAAMRLSTIIEDQDIILANTILAFAEYDMPKAMGEFGKGRNSAITHKILEIINKANKPINLTDLIKQCSNDLDNPSSLTQLTQALVFADKIQIENGCFLPKRKARNLNDSDLVKPSLLLPEETLGII